MLRRDFLKYTSAVAAMALLPQSAKAAEINYKGPLWIFVQAGGGWDPTSLCDPKGYFYTEEEDNDGVMQTIREDTPMNKSFKNDEIKKLPNGISYPTFLGNGDGPSEFANSEADNLNNIYDNFFTKYQDDILVINGIDTQTNGHSSGSRYMMSGRLSEGLPATSALIAGANIPASPLAFISSGGYAETKGFVAATRVGSASTLTDLAYVNKIGTDGDGNDITLVTNKTFERIKKAKEERILRQVNKQRLDSIKNQMKQYNLAHTGSNDLSKLVQYLDQQNPALDNKNNSVFNQGRFALAGYKAGLTASVNVIRGGFDTHSNHDRGQIPRLADILEGIDLIKQEAEYQGLTNDVIFVVGSEFGRTPGYNGGNGKDHWSVSSMMFLGPKVNGGRVIGSTTHKHQANSVNPQTLQVDNGGIKITYAHINKAIRKLAGIDKNAHINQYFPLDTSLEDLPIFS